MYGLQNAFDDEEEKIVPTTTLKAATEAASGDLTSISTVITTWLIVDNINKIFDKGLIFNVWSLSINIISHS